MFCSVILTFPVTVLNVHDIFLVCHAVSSIRAVVAYYSNSAIRNYVTLLVQSTIINFNFHLINTFHCQSVVMNLSIDMLN